MRLIDADRLRETMARYWRFPDASTAATMPGEARDMVELIDTEPTIACEMCLEYGGRWGHCADLCHDCWCGSHYHDKWGSDAAD
jgi:hypothetical protein